MDSNNREPLSCDDSCDSETNTMKKQLTEFGLDEDNLSKEEMSDLLKALRNSKSTMEEEELDRQKVDENVSSPKITLKRHYLNVRDRRMPWSILPSTITQAEKARTLAVYIKLMSINNYRQARQSANFAAWPPPIQIFEEISTTRVQPVRSTRSGRSVPVYTGFDDDSSDFDFVVTKIKKRKVSNSDNDRVYSNKVISLKRKSPKDENVRPIKEAKTNTEDKELTNNINVIEKDPLSIVED